MAYPGKIKLQYAVSWVQSSISEGREARNSMQSSCSSRSGGTFLNQMETGIICPLLIGIGLIFMIKGGGDKSPLFPYVSPGLSFSGLDDAMIQTEKKWTEKKYAFQITSI